ncbi:MAG: hypothetical protein IJ128_07010, partial [Firmicutes bacterium]|nr:hypothetical protein [Bacillota bacterium]
GGDDGGGANVIIDGGTVTAQGGNYAAGIGTGQKPADDRKGDGSLTVNGGNVTAKGGIDGAGIGGGENADGLKTTINGGYVYAKGQSYGAGIGGGENCKGGDVTINGGTVIAEAGDDCNCSDTNGGSAIGSGQGIKKDSDDVFGKFTLAESMMAVAGSSKANAVKILAGDRKNRVNNRNYALIRQCAHEEATSLEKDENGHKIQGCPYCGLDQQEVEEHVYREGKCRVCGYDQPRTITVTFDPGEHGTGTMEPYMAYPDEVYPLPKCGYDPEDGFAFTGWSVNENVKKAGQTIDVKENITVTAQWNAAGMNVWEGMQSKLDAGGNIKLENDIKAPNKKWLEALCIEKGRTVALDLNGYSIDMNKQGTTGLLVGGYSPPVNVTLKNGQIIDADASGVSVNEQSTLLLQDFTITGNSGFAIRMSMYEDTDYPGGGYISVAGKVKLSGNEEGGILLAKNRTINIADTLSEDSVIPVKLPETAGEACGIDNLVLPTKEQPRVITSGLKGKGNVECFTCDNKDYMIGETMDGEALIGIPTDITFDAGEGTSDAEHSMPEVKAACGGVYTLPSCGFEPPEKHVFQGWKAEGSDKVLPAGEKVTVTDELKLTACYEYAPQAVPVVLETGEGHEAIAQKIAESFNAGKEGSAAAGGSTVNIRLLENLTITGAEEKISSMMAKADISYDGEDGKSGLKWTGSVGQKPLSGYDSYKQYEEAECQNTPGHGGDPIGQIEEPQIKFYVHWNKPVTQIGLDIKEPVCGTEIKVDGGGRPDIVPKLTLTEVQPSEDAIASSQSTWGRNGSDSIFKGTMTGGEDYDVIASFEPAFGYYIAKNTAVTLNGKKLDADQLIERNSALELHATMTAVHDYGEAPTPVWTWNGYESATATFTCAADPSHAETFNDDEIYQKETRAATHTKEGVVSYTAAIEYGGGTYPNTRTQRIPRTDHEWGPADYTWMDDNRMVLAKRQCQLDPSHFDTEAVDTAQEVIAEPSCTEAGRSRFTAAFENEAFSAQTREEEIPALGHDWGDWTVTREATEAAEGEETRACSRCPETQTRAIPTLNHKHELRRVAAKEATCTEDGRLEYWVCDRGDFPCGRYFADQAGTQPIDDPFIRALGHDYQLEWNWNEDSTVATLTYVCANDEKDAGTLSADVRADETPATCEKAGKKSVTATVAEGPGGKTCSEVRTIEIPALGHSWSKWQNFDSAQHQRVCENDAAHTEKADHSWDEGKITVWPTMIREGVKTFTCQDCQTTRTETIPKITPDTPLPLTDNMVTISADTFTYNGRVQKPEVEVKYGAETVEPSQYTVAWSNEESTGAGTYTVTVTMREGEGFTTDPVEKTYTIEKLANPMTVKAAAKKVKAKKVKKKKQTVAALTVKGAQGKLTYKGTPVGKKAKKALKINAKNGKITVKKKTKKGTYKMKVKVTAAGNANYNAKTQTVTVKIQVK